MNRKIYNVQALQLKKKTSGVMSMLKLENLEVLKLLCKASNPHFYLTYSLAAYSL